MTRKHELEDTGSFDDEVRRAGEVRVEDDDNGHYRVVTNAEDGTPTVVAEGLTKTGANELAKTVGDARKANPPGSAPRRQVTVVTDDKQEKTMPAEVAPGGGTPSVPNPPTQPKK